MKPVTCGIFGTAGIMLNRITPAMQQMLMCDMCAIASRDSEAARGAAKRMDLARSYGSYQACSAILTRNPHRTTSGNSGLDDNDIASTSDRWLFIS